MLLILKIYPVIVKLRNESLHTDIKIDWRVSLSSSVNFSKVVKSIALMTLCMILFTSNGYAQDPNFHIYLCFGQSNMEGPANIESQNKIVDDRFQVLQSLDCSNLGREKDTWYTAIPPLS